MDKQKTLKIQFELSAEDFKYFRSQLERARDAHSDLKESEVVKGAVKLVKEVKRAATAKFIKTRIAQLEPLIAMLKDKQWRLEGEDRARVVGLLTYFIEPNDLIPDDAPAIGYLDDAIMVELVTRELRAELKAYADFCDFRDREGHDVDIPKLEETRESLQRRMRRTGRASRSAGKGSTHSPLSLF